MEFDPYSEPRSMGVSTLNQYLGPTRCVVREAGGRPEDHCLSPALGKVDCAKKPTSAKVSPEMAFQKRRVDKSGQFVNIEVPRGVVQKAVLDWVQELCDPAQMDSQELYGPIVAQEDGPTNAGSSPQEASPVSVSEPLSEPAAQTISTLAVRPHRLDTIRRLTGQPASPLVTKVHVNARPVLLDGNHVRNRVMQNLRNVSGVLPRDEEDGPQIPDDAPRVVSSQGCQNSSLDGATPSGTPQFTGTYTWVWATTPAAMY